MESWQRIAIFSIILIIVGSFFFIANYFGWISNVAYQLAWILPDKYCAKEKNLITYEISDYDSARSTDPSKIKGVLTDTYVGVQDSPSMTYTSYAKETQGGWVIQWIYQPDYIALHSINFKITYPSLYFTSEFNIPVDVVDCSLYSCTNDCIAGTQICVNGVQSQCANFDSDPCTEYGNHVTCAYGCYGNSCAYAPEACLDECSTFGQTRCYNSVQESCGNFDSDSCMEWGNGVSCAYGCVLQVCSSAPSQTIFGTPCGQESGDNSWICLDANTRAFKKCEIKYVKVTEGGVTYDGFYDRFATSQQSCGYGCQSGFCQADPGSAWADIQNILSEVITSLSAISPNMAYSLSSIGRAL